MQINRQTYETFFLLYVDGELSTEESRMVEAFADAHPDLATELDMLKGTIVPMQYDVVFEDKELLYRKEKARLVPFAWWRTIAAAVVLVFMASMGWLYLRTNKTEERKQPLLSQNKAPANKQINSVPLMRPDDLESKPASTAKKAVDEIPDSRQTLVRNTRPDVNDATSAVTRVDPEEMETRKVIRTPKPAFFEESIDQTVYRKQGVSVDVEPRELDDIAKVSQEETPVYSYVQNVSTPTDDDVIYFANTSISKKNKFRGVFRKATRILDKVTSIQ